MVLVAVELMRISRMLDVVLTVLTIQMKMMRKELFKLQSA
jgi:spore maturation protein SpmB